MKTINKILFRKIKRQLAIFCSAIFIVALSIAFFVAVKTVYRDFKSSGETYFKDNILDDAVFYGMFTEEDAKEVEKIEEVSRAEARHRFSVKILNNDTDAILLGESDKKIRIDRPYIHSGRDKLETNEIRINRNYAIANKLKIGDELEIEFNDTTNTFKITSLASYPNYIYLFKDGTSAVSENKDFAILEINDSFFKSKYIPYNTIFTKYQLSGNISKTENKIRDILRNKAFMFSTKEQGANFSNYNQTLLQIDAFAYICPAILLAMAALLLYVIQRRNVSVERKQIGIMKALGLSDNKILFIYIKYSFLVAFFGIGFAYAIVELALPPIFSALTNIFDIPNFTYQRYIDLWIFSSVMIFIVCTISNLVAAISILKLNPAQSMRGEVPKGGKKVFIESFKWWNKLSFNTRYSVKNAFRGKTRYLASIWGMFAAVSITIFSQGFNNSFDYFVTTLYNVFTKYDVKVTVNSINWKDNPDFLRDGFVKSYDKTAIYQARISAPYEQEIKFRVDNPVLVYKKGFSSLDIKAADNSHNAEEGIILSESIARRLKLKEGDYAGVEVYTFGKSKYQRLKITSIVKQPGMFFIYVEESYAKKMFDTPDTYNTLFLKTDKTIDINKIENALDEDENVASYSFKQNEEDASRKQIAIAALLVKILIVVAFLLGATSLYGVGIVTLATRRYEFTLLKVMGYSTNEIMLSSIKEMASQVIFAIPLGILAGYGALYAAKGPFSSDFFDFIPTIYTGSYIFAVVLLFAVLIFVSLISARYISKLDMVEGLKEREE